MASHSPIEQHAQRPGVALNGGRREFALQVLDEAAPWNGCTLGELGDAAGITPSPAAVRQNREPAITADQLTRPSECSTPVCTRPG
jgi:hypothetical protein